MDPEPNVPQNSASNAPHRVVTTGEAGEDASSPSPRGGPQKLPPGSHKAGSTQQNYSLGAKYINMWLEENHYPKFEDLSDEDVEADHLQNFIENIMYWLAVTPFKTSSGWLVNRSKEQYFSNIKNAFKLHFPNREIWASNKEEWWKELFKDFKTNCERSRLHDATVEEARKSIPLYRDVSKARTNSTTVRAKHMNDKADLRSVAMGMIKEASAYSIQKLFELNLCWQAIGRGGEHVFLCWTEMRWDDFFEAPDFDWCMSKQTDQKCTLLFCDRHLYCLCPLFSMGLFMMFDGVRRDVEATKGAVVNYVFPLMHKLRKDSVADGLSKAIKKYIKKDLGELIAAMYSSRSVRKGGMTHNRANRNLSTQEEYARSGHMAPGMNGNAEGYIDSTPALSAPGGLSLAGYIDPHGDYRPMSFRCLGNRVQDLVARFIDNLIVNDVECLQENGVNREVLVTCAACVVGWYNDLVRDVGPENAVVVKIHKAAQQSQLSDDSVTPSFGAPVWKLVLKKWSKQINEAFQNDNPQMPSFQAPLVEQYMGVSTQLSSVLSRLTNVESSVAGLSQSYLEQQTLNETNKVLADKVIQLTAQLQKTEESKRKLQRRLDAVNAAAISSPGSIATPTRAMTAGTAHAGSKRSNDEMMDNDGMMELGENATENQAAPEPSEDVTEQAAAAQLTIETMEPSETTTPRNDGWGFLDGIVVSRVNPKDITARSELERMWHANKFKDKTDDDGNRIPLPRRALFDSNCGDFLGYNPDMARDQSGLKKAYTDAMTVVAVSMEQRHWDTLREETLTEIQMRHVVGEIISAMQATLKRLQIDYCGRAANSTFKTLTNLRAVGNKWRDIIKKVSETMNNNQEHVENWLRGMLGEPPLQGNTRLI